jgi:hypothetical protein
MNFQKSAKTTTNQSLRHYSYESMTLQLDPCLFLNSDSRSLVANQNRGGAGGRRCSRFWPEEGSPTALEWCGSISITGRIHRCPWLGPRWPEVARPRAPVAKPTASPAAGRSGDAWSERACARGGARQGEGGGVCSRGCGGVPKRERQRWSKLQLGHGERVL